MSNLISILKSLSFFTIGAAYSFVANASGSTLFIGHLYGCILGVLFASIITGRAGYIAALPGVFLGGYFAYSVDISAVSGVIHMLAAAGMFLITSIPSILLCRDINSSVKT